MCGGCCGCIMDIATGTLRDAKDVNGDECMYTSRGLKLMISGLDHTFSEVIPDLFGEHLSYALYPSTYFFFFSCFQQLDHKKEKKSPIISPCLTRMFVLCHKHFCIWRFQILHNKSSINIQYNFTCSFQTLLCRRFLTIWPLLNSFMA